MNIENLKAVVYGKHDLNIYQKADAIKEFENLIKRLEKEKPIINRCECDKCDPNSILICANCDGFVE